MKRKGLIFGAVVAGAALLRAGALAQQQTTIAIATGGTGGVYYPLGGGMANMLTKYVPGYAATARVTGGSVDNLKLIGSKQSEVAMVMVDAAVDALKGEDKFKGNPVEVRTLMVLYPNRMHVVSIEGKGIEKMSDLKGKRVSTGSPRQRDRGDGVPRDRGGRPRQGQGHAARAARRCRVHQRAQGRQDRRLLLGRRSADRGRHRSRRDARRQDQADRPRRRARQNECEVRRHLQRRRHSGQDLSGPGQGQPDHRRCRTSWSPTPACRTRWPTTSSRPSSSTATI